MTDLGKMARELLPVDICRYGYEVDEMATVVSFSTAIDAIRAALLTAPPGYVLVDRAQIGTALDSVRSAMEAAFHRRFPECCGSYSPAGCCGNPREAWSEDDRATMDTLHPVEQALSAMLAAAPEVK